jgi:tetratricopeptide (TPR) repeat protein
MTFALACALALTCLSGCGVVSHGQNADGVRLYQQGQYQQAAERFQAAINKDPTNADGYYNLASTYNRIGTANRQPTQLDQAETLYRQCLDRNPDHTDCRRALAVLLVERNRSEEAVRMLEGWSQRSPTLAAPHVELARLSQELGDRKAARDQLLQAINCDPYNSRAFVALGKLNEEEGNTAQAIANYERSLASNNMQPEVAARVASLRSTMAGGTPGTTSPNGTRMAATPQPTLAPTQTPKSATDTRTVSTPTPAVR